MEKKEFNLATYIPDRLTVYEMLTELNLEQLDEMKEMVEEVKLMRLREKYFREDLDELDQNETFYRWEFNECYEEGGENIWYTCLDYLHDGGGIILSRKIPNEDEWTIIFISIEEKYPGDCRKYFRDKYNIVIREKDVNNIVIHAENYIRKFKNELERI